MFKKEKKSFFLILTPTLHTDKHAPLPLIS